MINKHFIYTLREMMLTSAQIIGTHRLCQWNQTIAHRWLKHSSNLHANKLQLRTFLTASLKYISHLPNLNKITLYLFLFVPSLNGWFFVNLVLAVNITISLNINNRNNSFFRWEYIKQVLFVSSFLPSVIWPVFHIDEFNFQYHSHQFKLEISTLCDI